MSSIERILARVEATFGVRMAAARERLQRKQDQRHEKMKLKSMQIRIRTRSRKMEMLFSQAARLVRAWTCKHEKEARQQKMQ
eukprot:4058962-Amphidinium_carterae.1